MFSNSSWVEGKLEGEMFKVFEFMLVLAKSTGKNEN